MVFEECKKSFCDGSEIDCVREHSKSRDTELEFLYIEIDGKTIFERRFEGKLIPETEEDKFANLKKQLEELSRKDNVEVVSNTVKRIADYFGYQVNLKRPSEENEGKNAFIYYIDEYYQDMITVKFIDSGKTVGFWLRPLWYQCSNIWRDRFNTSRSYWGWTYQKFIPDQVEKEIKEELNSET